VCLPPMRYSVGVTELIIFFPYTSYHQGQLHEQVTIIQKGSLPEILVWIRDTTLFCIEDLLPSPPPSPRNVLLCFSQSQYSLISMSPLLPPPVRPPGSCRARCWKYNPWAKSTCSWSHTFRGYYFRGA
jgi:hypothetical protein